MTSLNPEEIRFVFSQAHGERLSLIKDKEGGSQFSTLGQMLADLGYATEHATETISSELLANSSVLVIGAPQADLALQERAVIEQFVEDGGGLFLGVDSSTMMRILSTPNTVLYGLLADLLGAEFHEYHNYPPTYLQEFRPHSITAGVRKIEIGDIAALKANGSAMELAWTRATHQTVMAYANVEQGRVLAVGDLDWLADDLLTTLDNDRLAARMFRWLAGCNIVDVDELTVPDSLKWGENATVALQLRNSQTGIRPQVECILESDADALIDEPVRKRRSIPPGKTTQMRWTMHPQVLGDQKLRLTIHIDQAESLYFDDLPTVNCLAPGYLTLAIRNAEGEQQTSFQTGDHFTAEGVFHWDGEEQQDYHLELETEKGLLCRGFEEGHGISRWHLQAVAPGQHSLTLRLVETEQSLPAMVKVKPSIADRRDEIRAAYVCPLDAEIAERLRHIDARLGQQQIRQQPFTILSPEKFIQEVYAEKDVLWLQGLLAAARREQYQNFELLDLFLTHIAPTYLPSRGTFIPYDPSLASRLAELHPTDRRYLEYNLLHTEESEDITIKQNVAAYLLHEKYGHGFFYTQTRLGQQLALLLRHRMFGQRPEIEREDYGGIASDIKDSAIIVNEGFATWLELTFLGKLDREVRQAVYPRRVLLVEEATGLYNRQRGSDFFEAFHPRYDSPYREGFEYLDFISKKLDPRCAIRAFLIATDTDLGIVENAQGDLEFNLKPAEIRELLFASKSDWRSQARLRTIAELVYKSLDEVQALVREQHCPTDCRRSGCPFEAFVEEELDWRLS
jgi:hypothetical protein